MYSTSASAWKGKLSMQHYNNLLRHSEYNHNTDMGKQNNRCLLIFAVVLSFATLLVSLVLLGWAVNVELSDSDKIEELENRLGDLETEEKEKQDLIPVMKPLNSRPPICFLSPDPGPCDYQIIRWYHLSRGEDCFQFSWGACQGNDNNFRSLYQCQTACHVPVDKQVSTSARVSSPSPILTVSVLPYLKEQAGYLQGDQDSDVQRPMASSSWSEETEINHDFNVTTSRPGVFDGFEGFGPVARDKLSPKVSPSDCNLPPDTGYCQDRVTRFYYDGRQCQRFQYGGCSESGNHFLTMFECEQHCGEDRHTEIDYTNPF